MRPQIELRKATKLVGRSVNMSMAEDKSFELWHGFMKNRLFIKNAINSDLFSIQLYDPAVDFSSFNPRSNFIMWAATEVSEWIDIPENFQSFELEGGLYAVFIHKGLRSDFQNTMKYIFGQWLPRSPYEMDQRAHFQIMGEKYRNNDENSEEEVWIPVK